MYEILGQVALQGGKKVAATFGAKLATAMIGGVAAHAVNTAIDKSIVSSVEKGECEMPDQTTNILRHLGIDSIGAALGAVGFSFINDGLISQ